MLLDYNMWHYKFNCQGSAFHRSRLDEHVFSLCFTLGLRIQKKKSITSNNFGAQSSFPC